MLKSLLSQLDQNIKNEETKQWLTPLYQTLSKQKLPRRVNLQSLFALPINERNHIAHNQPSNADYWQDLADALQPFIQWLSQQTQLIELCQQAKHPQPWFIAQADDVLTYNGIHKNTISYVGSDGTAHKRKQELSAVFAIFQQLMGKTELQTKQFKELLGKLAPEELKGVFMGDYLIGEIIGEGTHGIVHKGIQLSTGRQVAIKLLKDKFADDEEIPHRFKQEAKLLSQLNHPNIVNVIGYGEVVWQASKIISLKDEA